MSWGDQSAVWPAAVGSIARNNLEEIRQAIEERRLAAGLGSFTGTGSAFAAGEITREHMVNIQSAITTLIANYVNHTDNSGAWTGQASIPYWAESTIIAAIGDASRLSVPATQYTFRAWINQQYDILNLLLWTKSIEPWVNASSDDISEPLDTDRATTWANAQSSYMAIAGNWAGSSLAFPVAISGWLPSLNLLITRRVRAKLSYSGVYGTIAHATDWYARADVNGLLPSNFSGEGVYVENRYYLYEATAAAAATAATSGYFNNTTDVPPEPFTDDEYDGWAGIGESASAEGTIVFKWNVTGGFSFIA